MLPDAVITGFSFPVGVGADGRGFLYVSDAGTSMVYVFAPGANGQAKPVRTIPVDVTYLVTWGSYFIAEDQFGEVNVYQDDGNGVPIQRMLYPSSNTGLAVRPNGKLYLSWVDDPITVYDTVLPPREMAKIPKPSQEISRARPGWYGTGLAVDDRDIFADTLSNGPVRIAVLPIASNGPTRPRRTIVTPACNGGGNVASYTLAVGSKYLYEACAVASALFLYDKRADGRVDPVYTLSGPFTSIFQVTIGR